MSQEVTKDGEVIDVSPNATIARIGKSRYLLVVDGGRCFEILKGKRRVKALEKLREEEDGTVHQEGHRKADA